MKAVTERARHVILRIENRPLPSALLDALRDEVVTAGWVRGGGVLEELEIRALSGAPRAIHGAVHAVVLEGSVGLVGGDVACALRGVFAREGERGLESFAGEVVRAKARSLEILVTAFDDVAATRVTDPATGVSTIAPDASTTIPARAAAAPAAAPAPAPVVAPPAAVVPPPVAVAAAAPSAAPPAPGSSPALPTSPMPLKPVRPSTSGDDDVVYPDAGDIVEHFHFGKCEVLKSDGDRLHLRDEREGRIKEIALEKLRVTPMPTEEGGPRRFKLDRKL